MIKELSNRIRGLSSFEIKPLELKDDNLLLPDFLVCMKIVGYKRINLLVIKYFYKFIIHWNVKHQSFHFIVFD